MTDSPWFDLDAYVSIPRIGSLRLSHDGSTLLASVQQLDAEKTACTTSLWRGADRHRTADFRRPNG